MQAPPSVPPSSPPPGYMPPKKSGVPVWVWIILAVVGVCVILPIGLAAVGLFSFGKAMNEAVVEASKNAKVTTAKADNVPAGWTHQTVGEFSVAFPSTWTPLDPNDKQQVDAVNKADASNTKLASLKPFVAMASGNNAYKFFLVQLPPDKESAFASNINIIASPAPAGATLEQLAQGGETQAKKMGEGGVKSETEHLAGGDAALIKWQMQQATMAGKVMLDLRTYMIIHDGTGYVITVAFPARLESSLDSETDSIAKSFNFK